MTENIGPQGESACAATTHLNAQQLGSSCADRRQAKRRGTKQRSNGDVTSSGPEEAWNRMLVATNYLGRRKGLAEELIAADSP